MPSLELDWDFNNIGVRSFILTGAPFLLEFQQLNVGKPRLPYNEIQRAPFAINSSMARNSTCAPSTMSASLVSSEM